MNDQPPKDDNQPEKKGFCLNKTEQLSRIWHNFTDGAYKLVIIIGVVVAIIIGANIWFTLKSTTNKVHTTYCESVFWCDTEAETQEKAEKAAAKAAKKAAKEAEKARALAAAAKEDGKGEDTPGVMSRGWNWVKNKATFSGGDTAGESPDKN